MGSTRSEGRRGWPDRRALARPLDDEVRRQRLIDLLAGRWVAQVVLVEAPGGYGKSTAVAQAIRDNDTDPTGLDVYVRCPAAVRDVAGLAASIADALALESAGPPTAVRFAEQLASFSPQEVALHLDDVHRLVGIDGVDRFLDELIEHLPVNGHVVLVGRSLPTLRLQRLRAADGVIEVRQHELAFDLDEQSELARRHAADLEQIAIAGGWPAAARLALAVGPDASVGFLVEEVIETMTVDERRGVAACAIAGRVDADLLAACAATTSTADLARLPLVVRYDDGAVGAHDLWTEALDQLVDDAARDEIAAVVVDALERRRDRLGAIDVALANGRWSEARRLMVAVLSSGDAAVSVALLHDWSAQLPAAESDEPEAVFVEMVERRMRGDLTGGTDRLVACADQFAARRDAGAEAAVCVELGVRAWLTDDRTSMASLAERVERLASDGLPRMRSFQLSRQALAADLRGDFRGALSAYEAIPERDELILRHRSTLSLLTGDADGAVAILDELVARFDKPLVRAHAAFVRWHAGDPSAVLETAGGVSRSIDNRRNVFLVSFFEAMIGANLGRVPDIDAVARASWDRPREQTFLVILSCAVDLYVADEAAASERFESGLAQVGWDEPLALGELRRFLPYAYILSPTARAMIDDLAPELGPLHVELLGLSRALLAARDGVRVGVLPPPESILTWLPLPWSTELAARLAAADDPRGVTLANHLADTCGSAVHRELRRLVDRADGNIGAERLLATVPAPPDDDVVITVCGRTTVATGGDAVEPSRLRVRQLLGLLTLRRDLDRSEVIGLLWPGLEPSKARANLRATLLHLRRTLEPDRQSGEAFFHVRQRDERIWLQREEGIRVDLWELHDLLAAARVAERAGEHDAAVDAARRALSIWRPDALVEIADLGDVSVELAGLQRNLLDSACRVAERTLAAGDGGAAIDLAEAALLLDPAHERAHDVIIAAALLSGDLVAAGAAIDECLRRLSELGLSPSSSTEMLIRRHDRRSRQRLDDAG